jgi:DNA (cytosine-5)-methyltransferase 1
MKLKLLDLFCGAGGASMGYYRAGFEVEGVDIKPQPHYPFKFHLADALEFPLDGYDAYHASPPCQAYTIARNNKQVKAAPDLIERVRHLLVATGKLYIIENVYGSPLASPAMICGASFGLGVNGFDLCRHRYFETNFVLMTMPCQHRRGFTIGVYGHGANKWHREKFGRCVTVDEFRQAMGIDWMIRKELSQAIPPAYTEYIGKLLVQRIYQFFRDNKK